jgi:hypothetical protein
MATTNYSPARLRSSLANAAWTVEERVVWGGADAAKGALDAIRWPFERIAWAIERHLIWPVQDRTSGWSEELRMVGVGAIAVAAIGAGVLGVALATPGKNDPTSSQLAAPTVLPLAPKAPAREAAAPTGPVLHGVAPAFKDAPGGGASAGVGTEAKAAPAAAAPGTTVPGTPDSASTAAPATGAPAGPVALKVARRFADAFVLYEIGKGADGANIAFRATATPQLAHSLLQRPPRLPANVKVPQAKVVNLVAGQSHDGVYPISVSLLRVGVTSELRLDMQKVKRRWLVTDVTG